jgi:hypothetical protein
MPRVLLAGLTFLLVCFAWVFFRARTFDKAYDVLSAMVGFRSEQGDPLLRKYEMAEVIGIMGAILVIHWMMRDMTLERLVAKTPWWLRSVALALMLVGIAMMSGEDRAFIYFQF